MQGRMRSNALGKKNTYRDLDGLVREDEGGVSGSELRGGHLGASRLDSLGRECWTASTTGMNGARPRCDPRV